MAQPINASDLDGLDEFATVRQLEFLEAIRSSKSMRKASEKLGVSKSSITNSITALKARAAKNVPQMHDYTTKNVPDGFAISGVSQYDTVEKKWIKTTRDEARRAEIFKEFIEQLCQGIKGMAPTIAAPAVTEANLLAVYPIGDHHHGMYSDAEETGSDYDCKIASHSLETAVDYLATLAPPAETALLINLGDYYHANDSTNETPGHGNRLDVDTRYGQVMYSGAMALVRCVLRLLEKHQRVVVWNMRGNHDPDASMSLAMAMRFYFHNEPRVEVDMGSSLYKYLRFGNNLIGSHHGHGAKGVDLPLLMAVDRKEDWGQTEHRVWHCGHIHHKTQKEFPGVVVETHRTLAGSDAWHAGKGYRSKKDMNAIVYHSDFGEIQRTRFDMQMVK
jgi:hypothetical protein